MNFWNPITMRMGRSWTLMHCGAMAALPTITASQLRHRHSEMAQSHNYCVYIGPARRLRLPAVPSTENHQNLRRSAQAGAHPLDQSHIPAVMASVGCKLPPEATRMSTHTEPPMRF